MGLGGVICAPSQFLKGKRGGVFSARTLDRCSRMCYNGAVWLTGPNVWIWNMMKEQNIYETCTNE